MKTPTWQEPCMWDVCAIDCLQVCTTIVSCGFLCTVHWRNDTVMLLVFQYWIFSFSFSFHAHFNYGPRGHSVDQDVQLWAAGLAHVLPFKPLQTTYLLVSFWLVAIATIVGVQLWKFWLHYGVRGAYLRKLLQCIDLYCTHNGCKSAQCMGAICVWTVSW